MKTIATLGLCLWLTLSLAAQAQPDSAQKTRLEKAIQKAIDKENQIARDQTFYKGKYYDLKSSEVDEASLDSIPVQQVDDLDMDRVYD